MWLLQPRWRLDSKAKAKISQGVTWFKGKWVRAQEPRSKQQRTYPTSICLSDGGNAWEQARWTLQKKLITRSEITWAGGSANYFIQRVERRKQQLLSTTGVARAQWKCKTNLHWAVHRAERRRFGNSLKPRFQLTARNLIPPWYPALKYHSTLAKSHSTLILDREITFHPRSKNINPVLPGRMTFSKQKISSPQRDHCGLSDHKKDVAATYSDRLFPKMGECREVLGGGPAPPSKL